MDQEVTFPVGQEQLDFGRQVSGQPGKRALEVDVDHNHPKRFALGIDHGRGQQHGGLTQPGVCAKFVVDHGARLVGAARWQLQGV